MNRFILCVSAACMALLASVTAQAGSDISPADLKALHDYTLTMAKIEAVGAVIDDLKQLQKSNPAFAKMANNDSDDAKNLSDAEAKFNADPRVAAILKKHGVTAADVVLAPLVLMSAGISVAYPSAAGKLSDQTSPAQIAFFKAHQAELKKIAWVYGSGQ